MGEPRGGRRRRRVGYATIAAALVVLAMPTPAPWIERFYARTIYPRWQHLVTPLGDPVPFALFDVWLALAFVALAAVLVTAWRQRQLPGWRRALEAIYGLLVLASVVYLWFMASWGFNYRRAPLETRLDFSRERVTASAAGALAERTIDELNRLHPLAWAQPWPAWRDVPRTLTANLGAVSSALSLPYPPRPGLPHVTMLQPYFRWASIEGMTNPFLLEVIVNDDLLPMERPAMVAHEWGHLAGLGNEAEASYFGWRLARAADIQAQYSGWLFISGYALSAIPDQRRAELVARLGPGPRRDLRAMAARQARAVPVVRQAAWVAYDRYLKSNRVAAGVESYDEVLVLVLGTLEGATDKICPSRHIAQP